MSADSILRKEPLCKGGCGMNEQWCTCPPPAKPARPAWQESYPPIHCIICGSPMFEIALLKNHVVNVTCGEKCHKEAEWRHYSGAVMQKPYEKDPRP
jgi:hypothetical protein